MLENYFLMKLGWLLFLQIKETRAPRSLKIPERYNSSDQN